eukprot:scaffold18281_cov78-Phaeocystis_antarctica.AAC.6
MQHGAQRARCQPEDKIAGRCVCDIRATREQPSRHLEAQWSHLTRRVAAKHVEHVAKVETGGRHRNHAAVSVEGTRRNRLYACAKVDQAARPLEVSLELDGRLGRRTPVEGPTPKQEAGDGERTVEETSNVCAIVPLYPNDDTPPERSKSSSCTAARIGTSCTGQRAICPAPRVAAATIGLRTRS